MTRIELINEALADREATALTADGFDEAILGIADNKVVYSITKCINILMKRDGMSYIDAMEYFSFNVEGSYMGNKTPIWVDDFMLEAIEGEL